MNLFIKKKNTERRNKIVVSNYGLSHSSCSLLLSKNGISNRCIRSTGVIQSVLNRYGTKFNRFLRTKKAKIIQNYKKQSSWRALRIRQGLPLNGQRTHTNARTAKRWVPSLEHASQ